MLSPTEVVNLHVLRHNCEKSEGDRTVNEDRRVRSALDILRRGTMTHVLINDKSEQLRKRRIDGEDDEEAMANMNRVPLTTHQYSFVRHVLPAYFANRELLDSGKLQAAMAVHDMAWDDCELLGEEEGWS